MSNRRRKSSKISFDPHIRRDLSTRHVDELRSRRSCRAALAKVEADLSAGETYKECPPFVKGV